MRRKLSVVQKVKRKTGSNSPTLSKYFAKVQGHPGRKQLADFIRKQRRLGQSGPGLKRN